MTIGSGIKQQAALWDLQFSARAHQLQPDQLAARVTNAWLAGYRAAQHAARVRRAPKKRSQKR